MIRVLVGVPPRQVRIFSIMLMQRVSHCAVDLGEGEGRAGAWWQACSCVPGTVLPVDRATAVAQWFHFCACVVVAGFLL